MCSIAKSKDLGVRKLIEFTLRSGDLGALIHSQNTAANGSRIHRRIQRRRGKSYQPEVYLSQRAIVNHHHFLIHGRADGIIMRKHPLIEEIKTSDVDFDQMPQSILILYWGQVKMYAHLLMNQHPEIKWVKLRLTYVKTPENHPVERTQRFTNVQAHEFYTHVLKLYQHWMALRDHIVHKRNRSARKFKFPFPHYRTGQHEMAAAVYKTILFHKHLFCEAPTGTGKTISTLFPCVKAMGEDLLNRVFYLTAKKSTRHVAEATVNLLAQHGLHLKSITITAKEDITFPQEIDTDPADNPYMVGYYDRLKPALHDLLIHNNQITKDVIIHYAKKYTLDPFEFSLDASLFCDVVICDYNYLFNIEVYLLRFFSAHDDGNFFLIDEAHNLVSRSRDMYSADMSSAQLQDLLTITKHHRSRCYDIRPKLQKLMRTFEDESLSLDESHQYSLSLKNPLKGFNAAVAEAAHAIHKWLPRQQHRDDLVNAVIQFYFACTTYLTMGDLYDDTYRTRMIHDYDHQVIFREFCIDPSQHLAHSLNLGRGAVLFSATLTPMNYYRRVLGNEKDSLAYQLPSAFPPQNQRVLITNYIQTTYRQRQANQSTIIKTIHALISGKRGHYLIFFPSYQYLDSVAHDFKQRYPQVDTLVQTSDMTNDQQKKFIHRFKTNYSQTLVGFAIMGSNFSEGIDLKGPALIGVAIVTVGLPKINDQTDLVRDYFDQEGHGFEYAYQLPGLNKVLQAAGRLIRSAKDEGIVALIDQRFSWSQYRRFLPSFWHPQAVYNLQQFKQSVDNFWQNQ
ncbi:MAG: ATP-dependent DNA helicase [Acetilactobacillus jinshanensis]